MRIAVLFPSIYASQSLFPDRIFAPKELCIDLVNGLVDRGHEVTVYSVPDLPVKATVISESLDSVKMPELYYKFRHISEGDRKRLDGEFAKHGFEFSLIERCFADARDGKFDVVHVYHDSSYFLSHYLTELLPQVPVCYTLHDPLPPEGTYEFRQLTRFSGHNFVSISNAFRHSQIQINFVDTVYHGIDMTIYPFNSTPDNYVLFLGRLVPEKGLHHAIGWARKSGMRLVVSVNLPEPGSEDAYYRETIGSLSEDDKRHIEVIGVVDKAKRIDLYQKANALLFPIEWEEPFGIVMIEAMACGTPVVAFRRGSVPEIVSHGVSGIITESDDTLNRAVSDAISLDRASVRHYAEETFTVEKMVEGYEQVYRTVISTVQK